jgi:hypothetical protein
MSTRYFTYGESRSFEVTMQSVPGSKQRGGGRYVFERYRIQPEDCDCKYCLYAASSRGRCGLNVCVCIEERILAGCEVADPCETRPR